MSGSAPGRREVAYRVFAAEFDDATVAYSESDEERAPNYVVTPTGARANRLFAVGVLTAVEDVNPEMVRGRVVDPTGPFVTYAGQYQPDALAFLERADPPTFVALTGKARTFEPDDGDAVYSSVRPESVNAVEADTRDRWVVTAAERTLIRIGLVAAALEAEPAGDRLRAALEEAGVDERLADGVALALEHYGTTPAYLDALRETALDAVGVVAGELDEAGQPHVQPDAAGGPDGPAAADLASVDLSGLPTTPVETASADADVAGPATSADAASMDAAAEEEEEENAASVADTAADAGPGAEDTGEPGDADAAPDADAAADGDVDAERETAAAPDVDAEAADAPDAEADPADTEPADTGTGPGDFEGGEFDLDEETRQDVEEEYGTEFSTADEVESADAATSADAAGAAADDAASAQPGAAAEPDVDAGEPDDPAGAATDDEAAGEAASTSAATQEAATDDIGEAAAGDGADETTAVPPADETTTEDAADETTAAEAPADGAAGEGDLEDAVMAAMETVGDGEGTDRAALVDAVVEAEGADRDEVEAAIEDALMSGRCYEPDEGTLKAI